MMFIKYLLCSRNVIYCAISSNILLQQPFKVGTIIPTTEEKMILIEFQELTHHLAVYKRK